MRDKPPRDPVRRQSNTRPRTTPIHSTGFSWKAGRFNESYTSAPVGCTDDGSGLLIPGIACQYCVIADMKGLCSTNVALHALSIVRCSTRYARHQLSYLRLPGLPFAPSANTAPMRRRPNQSEYVRVSDEGSCIKFHFWPHCGATVYYEPEGLEEYPAIPVGAFAELSFPAQSISVYEQQMHSWVVPLVNAEHIL